MRLRHLFWIIPLLLVAGGLIAFRTVLPAYLDGVINRVHGGTDGAVSEAARVFHNSLIVADLHSDSLLWNRDLTKRWDRGHMDVPRMLEGNMALQVFTTVTRPPLTATYDDNSREFDVLSLLAIAQGAPRKAWHNPTERALNQASRLHEYAERSDGRLMIVKNVDDLDRLFSSRESGDAVVGGLLGTEGSHALTGDLSNIDRLYDAGFRMMSLHHFFDNRLGGSLHGEVRGGLTPYGRNAVKAMEERSIMIDVSHSSEQVVAEVLEIAERPLIVSHTGIKGHCNSHRNISDDLMVRIAEKGGLIGIGFWGAAICDASPEGIARAIRAAVDLVGPDHVALGSDFDGAVSTPVDVSDLVWITDALMQQGVDQTTIRKVMGQNQIDFFRKYLPAA